MAMATMASPAVEELRSFLNSWLIPNDTRVPTETLADLSADAAAWRRTFARVPVPRDADDMGELVRLRDDLRADVEEHGSARLDAWLERCPQTARIENGELVFRGAATPQGEVLRVAAELVNERRWRRLRACPDCRWIFYDQSRNNSRTWCSMYAGDSGRACGSIAKVKRMRSRKAAQAT
ncbi:CGNR zinc finger domain-containing protein [Streptomyces sp. NBC_01618]|uniref:CGNR zinc finger domain-containing protein n=1 Tax=Streptomyces sp. NBC_01618 TaxID=2975900 RepID=UPI00386AF634|nr:CGNR zinc finger domain-containing protein [Streptomyces sp. NBC_01618]